jgi:hypothetical protein
MTFHSEMKMLENMRVIRLGALVFFGVLSLLFLGVIVRGADVEETSNSVPVTFESFLRNPPVIDVAEFEIINPPPSSEQLAAIKQLAENEKSPAILSALPQLASGQTNPCWLRLDKTNYILNRPTAGGYSGKVGSVEWELVGNWLKLVDRKINDPDQEWLAERANSMWPVRRFLNLGMEHMIPNTLIWTNGADNFIAECDQALDGSNTNRGKFEVQLHYVKGVPLTATTKDVWGTETEITYKYDSTFFGGQLPVEFNVVKISQDIHGPVSKLFSLRIKKLQLSENPIDASALNPTVSLKEKYKILIVLSNNVAYGVTRLGKMQPVISPEEANQRSAQAQAKRLEQRFPFGALILRALLVIIVLVPPLLLFGKVFRKGNK